MFRLKNEDNFCKWKAISVSVLFAIWNVLLINEKMIQSHTQSPIVRDNFDAVYVSYNAGLSISGP